uniref:Ovule protein n=1 Tax=Steinernema glaseri TaxID=37863 RepID=A0A1I7Y6N2_9BILA
MKPCPHLLNSDGRYIWPLNVAFRYFCMRSHAENIRPCSDLHKSPPSPLPSIASPEAHPYRRYRNKSSGLHEFYLDCPLNAF